MPARERSFRVEALVLRHSDWGEADRLISLYSREHGKLRAIAKGVRKVRSRKAGHLEPFTRTSLLLARGRDLPLVTQADTIEAYLPLREDLVLVGYTSYVIELIDRFTYEDEENRSLYRLLVDTLSRLAAGQEPELVVRYYEIRLLDLLGFRPHLFHCANCEREVQPEDQFFSAELGGVLCPDCGRGKSGVRPISMTALKYLRHFQRSNFAEARRARMAPEIARELEILSQHYLTHLLERNLNSPVFLRRVRNQASQPDTVDKLDT
ncbi:MAG TPA: DNA repair protein RecO [Anaerolineales bacterium]|nr:DNA repair protein RecO [Anaerolineales bacterium]